jgi:nucleoside-diphosphate-sugar epimerase
MKKLQIGLLFFAFLSYGEDNALIEYEALQDRGFSQNIQKAEQLLGAMRSYTQHQKKVILLFTGAYYFDELEQPSWGTYFVNSHPLEVKYLSKEKTLQLTKPTEDFPII